MSPFQKHKNLKFILRSLRKMRLFLIVIFTSAFFCHIAIAQPYTEHQPSFQDVTVITSQKSPKSFSSDSLTPVCAEHGHGHCCTLMASSVEYRNLVNINIGTKLNHYSKKIPLNYFTSELIKPPIV